MRIANFTLHPQDELLGEWRATGFEMAPEPRAPLILAEAESWDSARVKTVVEEAIDWIASEQFEAVLVGGLTDAMVYACLRAWQHSLRVFVAISPRVRDPRTGRFRFEFRGVREILRP